MATVTPTLRFKLTFDLPNGELKVTDDAPYSSLGITSSTVKGLLRVTGPAGIIYANTGFTSNSYSSPDIDGSVPTLEKDITLPLDVDGNVLRGVYLVEYKIQHSGSVTTSVYKEYNFTYQSPTMNISIESDNRTSVITSTDVTDYVYQSTSPLTISRDHTLTPPVTSTLSETTGTAVTLTAGPNIWTRTWVASLTSTFTYELDEWTAGQDPWIYINDEITGQGSHDVESDDIVSGYYSCAVALSARYELAKTNNPKEANRLGEFIISLNKAFCMYQWAKIVGEDFTVWANQVYTILQVATDCATLPPSDKSREVIPWASISGGSGTTTNQWLNYEGVPTSGLGSNGDYCINTLTGDVYLKASGSWGSPIMNIIGPQGDEGESSGTGTPYYAYSAGSSTVTATQTIADFEIDPADLIPNVGDSLNITADLTISQPASFPTAKTVMNLSIIMKSTKYGEIRTETAGNLQLNVKITRASSTHVYITTDYSAAAVALSGMLDTGVINGGVYVQKSDPYGANADVVVNQLLINVQKAI